MGDYAAVEENLRSAMRFFGKATGAGEVHELDGSIGIFSGLDYGVFNIAMLTHRATINDGLKQRLQEIARFFKRRTVRWSVWLCGDMLDASQRRVERQVFAEFGMRAISRPPGM